MNARTRLAELIDLYHSFVEPYERIHSRNPQDLALKLDFCRAGEKMCGGPHQFALWFVFTFSPETLYNVPPEEYDQHTGKVMANIPRAMYGPILGYMNYISSFDSLVLPTTLEWWWKVGLYRFPDFTDRHSGIIAGATLFRTRFPNRMTEHEAMHMILQWLPSYAPEPATQTPPEPFIHVPPMVLCLPEPSVQVVPLLPAITDTPLVYGCDQFIQVPIDIDAAPAFAGQDNRTQWLAVRVVEVEPETVYTCREPKVERLPVLEDYAANKLLPVRARQSAFMFQNEVLNSRWMGAATERHGNLWDMTITQFNAFWQDFVFNAPAYLVEPILDNLLSKYAWREDKEWHAIQREEWTKKHRQPSAFFRLHRIISRLECKMSVKDRVYSRFDFFGQFVAELNNVTLQQLADYAEHLGYSPSEVQKILADHAKKQFGDGSERRLAS